MLEYIEVIITLLAWAALFAITVMLNKPIALIVVCVSFVVLFIGCVLLTDDEQESM